MKSINRNKLNERFVQVYEQLLIKGEIVKHNRKKSKTAFAGKLDTKGHIVDKWLTGERKITFEQAKKLCAHYGVSEAFMFQGIGKPFERKRLPDPEERIKNLLGINFSPNILFTNVEAFSSNTIGVDLWEENERFRIPGLNGDLVAFYINGKSMCPTVNAGDMVICSPLESTNQMNDDEVYAIVTNQSVWVKRIQRCFDRHGRWTHLKLISDNFEEFDPFLLEVGEVRKMLRVIRRLTGLEPPRL